VLNHYPLALGSRSFSLADQEAFAKLSGDNNPVHLDSLTARRSVVGAVIVHGMHLVLWALDVLSRSEFRPAGVCSLDVRFPKPVYLGDEVVLTFQDTSADEVKLWAMVGTKVVATCRLGCIAAPVAAEHASGNIADAAVIPEAGQPNDLAFDELEGKTGYVDFFAPVQGFSQLFPAAASLVGAARLREFAACSRLVGVICPGMRSVFGRMFLRWEGHADTSQLAYKVIQTYPEFHRITMRCEGSGIAGEIEAFSPPPPPIQLGVADLSDMVKPGEFEGQTALIIGGSRGLGELTAKLIAAGGGRVFITYAVGRDDARRVAEEIRAFGSVADILPYDIRQPAAEQLSRFDGSVLTHVYYYATCHISRAKTQAYEPERLEQFLMYYVQGFYNLCCGLAELGARNIGVFYPSSVFVAERSKGLTEYAMAKAAGEILCADLPSIFPGIRIHQERLVRLLTDQTSTVMTEKFPPAADAIIRIILSMRDIHAR